MCKLCKKRIKFQTFLQAWGSQPKVSELKLKVIETSKPEEIQETKSMDFAETHGTVKGKPSLTPQTEKEGLNQGVSTNTSNDSPKPSDTRISNNRIFPTSSFEPQISLEIHKQIIKWLSFLYLINIILFFIFFVIVYLYK